MALRHRFPWNHSTSIARMSGSQRKKWLRGLLLVGLAFLLTSIGPFVYYAPVQGTKRLLPMSEWGFGSFRQGAVYDGVRDTKPQIVYSRVTKMGFYEIWSSDDR
jgi:hypothetical protein